MILVRGFVLLGALALVIALAVFARENRAELTFVHCLVIAAALGGTAEVLRVCFDGEPEDAS